MYVSTWNFAVSEIRDKSAKKPKVEKKEPESPKLPKIPLMDPKSVRANAKKALFQTLWKRYSAQCVYPVLFIGYLHNYNDKASYSRIHQRAHNKYICYTDEISKKNFPLAKNIHSTTLHV